VHEDAQRREQVGEDEGVEDQTRPGATVLMQDVAVRGALLARLFVSQEQPKPIHQRVEEALDRDVRELGRRGLRLRYAHLLEELRGGRLLDFRDLRGLPDA
jgi:hypothetical protein